MKISADILCIGSVLWDVIGRCEAAMPAGADRPGRIIRRPGGVALNIAMALRRFGRHPALLSAVGRDAEGETLIAELGARGLECGFIHRPADLPTDQYMAIEAPNGLIAAIADAHSLEAAGDAILHPLAQAAPFAGPVVVDGNLTQALLARIVHSPLLARADLAVAPASPGKALRLMPFLQAGRGTLYVNLEEAGLLCGAQFTTAPQAASALRARGAARAVVTHGAQAAAIADADGLLSDTPPAVTVTRITGAGDTFLAAHIAAELRGETGADALRTALAQTALYVSGKTSI